MTIKHNKHLLYIENLLIGDGTLGDDGGCGTKFVRTTCMGVGDGALGEEAFIKPIIAGGGGAC